MLDSPLAIAEVGKVPLEHFPECSSYLRLVDQFGVSLSLHQSRDAGLYWLTGHGRSGDYKPLRLDLGGVRSLRDACELILADLAPTTPETKDQP